MSSRKLFSIFSNSYTITFSSFDHTIPVPWIKSIEPTFRRLKQGQDSSFVCMGKFELFVNKGKNLHSADDLYSKEFPSRFLELKNNLATCSLNLAR